MAKEISYGRMDAVIKDLLFKIFFRVTEFIFGQMGKNMMGSG